MKRREGVWREVERRRWEYGETQREFAQRLGVTQGHYSMVSQGKQAPGLKLVVGLIREFPEFKEQFLMAVGIVQPNQESAGE